jgi:hypothetical protein
MDKKAARGAGRRPRPRSLKRALSLERAFEDSEKVEALGIDENETDHFARSCRRFTRLRCLYASLCELTAIPEA